MTVRLVFDLPEVVRAFREDVERWAAWPKDCAWYREAVSLTCRPFYAECASGRRIYLWETPSGGWEVWGGDFFVEDEDLTRLSVEDQEEFVAAVPQTFYADSLGAVPRGPLADFAEQHGAGCRLNRLAVRWASWEAYAAERWSARTARKLEQERRKVGPVAVRVVDRFDVADYAWLLERAKDTAERRKAPASLVRSSKRGAFVNLMRAAERRGAYRCIRIDRGSEVVAREMFVADPVTRAIVTFIGYHDERFSGMGKLLYETLVRYAIDHRFPVIDAMLTELPVKVFYGFEGAFTWEIWIDKRTG